MLIFLVVILETKKLSTLPCLLTYLMHRSCCAKKMCLLSRFNLCKRFVKGSYITKFAGVFPATFSKMNPVTEDFLMPDSVNFRYLLSNSTFCRLNKMTLCKRNSRERFLNVLNWSFSTGKWLFDVI